MSQFHTSDFSFIAHRPGQSSTQPAASASPAIRTETIPSHRQQVKLPDAPALAVRKTLTPLPPAPRQPTPQSQHTQTADMPHQQALPMRPVLSAAPAWKRMARNSPHVTAEKAAGPLKDRLATLVNTPAQPGQAVQKHVAGVLPAHSAGQHPLGSAQAANSNGNLHTEQVSATTAAQPSINTGTPSQHQHHSAAEGSPAPSTALPWSAGRANTHKHSRLRLQRPPVHDLVSPTPSQTETSQRSVQQSAPLGLLVRESLPQSDKAGSLPGHHAEGTSGPQKSSHIGQTCSNHQAGADTSSGCVGSTSRVGLLPNARTANEAVDLVSPVPVSAPTERHVHASELHEAVGDADMDAWHAEQSPSPSNHHQADAATADGEWSDGMQQEVLSSCKNRLAAAHMKEVSVGTNAQKSPMQPKTQHAGKHSSQGNLMANMRQPKGAQDDYATPEVPWQKARKPSTAPAGQSADQGFSAAKPKRHTGPRKMKRVYADLSQEDDGDKPTPEALELQQRRAQEDEADKDLLVDIGSSKCKPRSRFHAGAMSSAAPLARSRLAFPIDSPASCSQQPDHAQTVAIRQSNSANKKQRHQQPSSRARGPEHALAAMRIADSSAGPGFDIEIGSPSNAAAAQDQPQHASSGFEQPSQEPVGAMMFDIDDDFGPAANVADPKCLDQPYSDLGYAQEQLDAVQPGAGRSSTQHSIHRGSSPTDQHLAARLQRHSTEPAVPASQHNALEIDIDDEACMGGSAMGWIPSASGMRQQHLQKPNLQLHTSQGRQAEPQQQQPNQESAPSPPYPGLDIDIDDDEPPTAHKDAANASATRTQQLSHAHPLAPSSQIIDTRPSTSSGRLAPFSQLLATNGPRPHCFKPPRRIPPLTHTANSTGNHTATSAAASLAAAEHPTSSASATGRTPSAFQASRWQAAKAGTLTPDSDNAEQGVPVSAEEAEPVSAEEAVPVRALKRLRKAREPAATSPAIALASATAQQRDNNGTRTEMADRNLVRQRQTSPGASSGMQGDGNHDDRQAGEMGDSEDEDEELQAGLLASSQLWQQHQQQQQQCFSLSQHSQQQQQQPKQKHSSWHGHRPSLLGTSTSRRAHKLCDSDHQHNMPSTSTPSTGFMSASAYVAAASNTQRAENSDCIHDANVHDGSAAATTGQNSTKGSHWGGFSTASSLLQQQRESDRQAKSDLLKKSNPFARASAQE